MHIQYCFPTAIFSTMNTQLADEMLPIAKSFLNDKTLLSNYCDFKTTYNPKDGLEKYAEVQHFADYVKDIGKAFLMKQGYKIGNEEFYIQIFVSEMFKGDYHNTHTHPNAIFSGVFYLQTPEGSSSLVFYDPRPKANFISREIEFATDFNNDVITVQPQKGMLLMWDSWLGHAVPKNTNEREGRITMVFNLYRK